jgi:acyl-CoA reductase-like NAD-dependent aldehyde dehydrogenase
MAVLFKIDLDQLRNSDAGMVMANLPTVGGDYYAPFGGRKASSYGPLVAKLSGLMPISTMRPVLK